MNLFVFYNFKKVESWKYEKINGWEWIGSGSTTPVFPKTEFPDYKHEEQFIGIGDIDEMIDYLTSFFENLKTEEIIKNYKICQTYNPYSTQ